MNIEKKMKIEGFIALTLSGFAAAIGLFWLVYILADVIIHGIGALQISLFFNDPAPAGVEGGGLRNAFVGQLMITGAATLIGVPVGVLGGTFLAEYARGRKFARVISILSARNSRTACAVGAVGVPMLTSSRCGGTEVTERN